MGRKHTEDSKAKISETRLARYGVSGEERKRSARERYERWAKANPDRAKAIKRRSYEAHRLQTNAKQREENKSPERKAFMRDYAPRHRAANPEKYRSYSQNRRAAQLGAAGTHTDAEWLALVSAIGGCAYCLTDGVRLTRDHDIPLVRGGSNDISNIVPACGPCNSSKGTLTGDEFRTRRRGEGAAMDPRWTAQLATARASSPTHRKAA